jgi:hypothetical protein
MAQEQKSTRRKEQKAPKNTSCPRAARPVSLPEGNLHINFPFTIIFPLEKCVSLPEGIKCYKPQSHLHQLFGLA